MQEILKLFSEEDRQHIQRARLWHRAEEIRIIAGSKKLLCVGKETEVVGHTVTMREVGSVLSRACEHSVYAVQPQLVQGFVTIRGGHRIGVAGRAAMEGAHVSAITDISALCIRIARDRPLAAEGILPLVLSGDRVVSTLLVGLPGSGKTTCLRSLSYLLGGGVSGKKVVVVDSRGELASSFMGMPGLSVGQFSCVLDRFPKKEAIEHAVRALAPDVIITDELGREEETDAALYALHAGIGLLASVHGHTLNHVRKNIQMARVLESGLMRQGVFLSTCRGPGTVERVVPDMTQGEI